MVLHQLYLQTRCKNVRVVVAESDLNNYPGMYLRKEDGKMKGYWATYPKK